MQRVAFNNYLDAVVCGLFTLLVVAMWQILSGRGEEEEPPAPPPNLQAKTDDAKAAVGTITVNGKTPRLRSTSRPTRLSIFLPFSSAQL